MLPLEPLSQRHEILRKVLTVAGDLGAAIASASACTWLIQQASLGVFLGFLVWLLGALVALALSQHIVHPTIQWAMSDDKLTRGMDLARAFGLKVQGWLVDPGTTALVDWLCRNGRPAHRQAPQH